MRVISASSAAMLLVLAGSRAWALEGGVEDRTTTHAVAVGIGSPSAPELRCSGTLVSANVVLTVRHCVAATTPAPRSCDVSLGPVDRDAAGFVVNVSPWTGAGSSWKRVASVVVPEANRICGDDVALLVLDRPVAEAEATPARPITTPAEFESAASGRLAGVAAFGATSASATDGGQRRSRWDLAIRCIPGSPAFPCGAELDYIATNEFTTGGGPCSGDSGAAAILPSDRGSVFGVLSRGNLAGGTCAEGIFVRTDAWAWLIARTVIDHAPPEGAPEWATRLFPPEPRAGELCHGAGSCGPDAECVSLDARRSWTCAARCADGACAGGHRCEDGLCLPGAPRAAERDGCAATPARTPTGVGALAIPVLAWAARRARRARVRR